MRGPATAEEKREREAVGYGSSVINGNPPKLLCRAVLALKPGERQEWGREREWRRGENQRWERLNVTGRGEKLLARLELH